MTPATVSVIIPVHNAESYLHETLSTLSGVERIEEIVIVDDSSTDRSIEVAQEFARTTPLPLVFVSTPGEKPLGPCAARNLGAKVVKGEILWFLDADDLYEGGLNDPRLTVLDNGADVVAGTIRFFRDGPVSREYALPIRAISVSTPLIRKSAFIQIQGFDESMWFGEDLDLVARLEAAGFKTEWVDALIISYRQHEDSLTHRFSDAREKGVLAAARNLILRARAQSESQGEA